MREVRLMVGVGCEVSEVTRSGEGAKSRRGVELRGDVIYTIYCNIRLSMHDN